jgi:hypothetical protein
MKLLTTRNYKTVKGEKLGYYTGILYLAPGDISGYEVCPKRSKGCTNGCLFTSGMGPMPNVMNGRIRKTIEFFTNRDVFLQQLIKDVKSIEKKAKKLQMTPAIRLNGTSDIEWTRFGIMDQFPTIQFYDYTKVLNRLTKERPPNYYLTFSRSENNDDECSKALELGYNVAVVFDKVVPSEWKGYEVINGDLSDVRFIDPKGVIVGLIAKGKAKKDKSGFVIKK